MERTMSETPAGNEWNMTLLPCMWGEMMFGASRVVTVMIVHGVVYDCPGIGIREGERVNGEWRMENGRPQGL